MMKILKQLLLAFTIALSLGAVSTQALAEEGRITFKPIDAINNVVKQIRATIHAIDGGAEGEVAYKMIMDALKLSKEINANDKVDIKRSRANGILKKARAEAKKEELQNADSHLKDAIKAFEDLKNYL